MTTEQGGSPKGAHKEIQLSVEELLILNTTLNPPEPLSPPDDPNRQVWDRNMLPVEPKEPQ